MQQQSFEKYILYFTDEHQEKQDAASEVLHDGEEDVR
jgi:hypothetical protein